MPGMQSMHTHFKSLLLLLVGFIFAAGLQYAAAAWTNPTASPPNNNTPPPVNVGTVDQVKDAGLSVNTLYVDGQSSFANTLDMNSNRILNLAAPTSANDAARMSYVNTEDDAVRAYTDAKVAAPAVNIDMGGFLISNLGAPTSGNDAARKTYVDSKVSTPGTSIDMGGNRITSLGAPSSSGDAATRGYVDGEVAGIDVGDGVMYLRAVSPNTPASCPSGWSSADYTSVGAGSSNNNVRTCYTSNACRVMYLRSLTSSTPAGCPSGWSAADYQTEATGGTNNNVRTCYICN